VDGMLFNMGRPDFKVSMSTEAHTYMHIFNARAPCMYVCMYECMYVQWSVGG